MSSSRIRSTPSPVPAERQALGSSELWGTQSELTSKLENNGPRGVSDCCTPKGYRQIFSEKNARTEARRYRRKGLDRTSRRIADLLTERGVEGKTLLEVWCARPRRRPALARCASGKHRHVQRGGRLMFVTTG
jgi:hypothetical protein